MYRALDALVDRGIISGVIIGQRPYSMETFGRFARQAKSVMDTLQANGELATIERAEYARLAQRLGWLRPDTNESVAQRRFSGGVRTLRLDGLVTDAPTRDFRENGLGSVEADLNTLTDRQYGRPMRTGGNLAAEADLWFGLPGQIGLQLRPRVWAHDSRTRGQGGAAGELLAANARVAHWGVALTAGREYTEWSIGEGAGLFFGTNAPALNMVRIANDAPFALPSILRVLGPTAATLQLADLGPSVKNSHSRLVSYKVSVRPSDVVEIGASFENHFGGAGAKNPAFVDRLIDLAPFVDIFRHHPDSANFDSDKLLGLDARLTVRRWGGATIFGELALEDFDPLRLRSIFSEDAAYATGLQFPSFLTPALSARFGYRVTGLRFYEHHLLTNGIASRRFILGDDLGRDAAGQYASISWRNTKSLRLSADAAYELRRNNRYEGIYVNPDQTGFVFRLLSQVPDERRSRLELIAEWGSMRTTTVKLRTGLERTIAFGSAAEAAQVHAVGALSFIRYR
ncbi:hypothetical protein BH09GEM1_BH09GEM1_04630 [soil metagenome]